jgi:hypothetical protein
VGTGTGRGAGARDTGVGTTVGIEEAEAEEEEGRGGVVAFVNGGDGAAAGLALLGRESLILMPRDKILRKWSGKRLSKYLFVPP